MKALVLAIALVAACSGKSKQDTTMAGTGNGSDAGSAILAKKVAVGFGITQNGSSAQVFLQTTDETGKQTSYPVGSYDGTCQSITPAAEMKALAGVRCTAGTSATELHAVAADASVVVLKLHVEEGVAPDPMAREEVFRVKVPPGAAIEPAPQL